MRWDGSVTKPNSRRISPRRSPARAARVRPDQIRVFGKAFGEDGARALKRGRAVADALLRIHKAERQGRRVVLGRAQQPVSKRLKPGLLGEQRLGAAFGFERQIDILKARLVVGRRKLGGAAVLPPIARAGQNVLPTSEACARHPAPARPIATAFHRTGCAGLNADHERCPRRQQGSAISRLRRGPSIRNRPTVKPVGSNRAIEAANRGTMALRRPRTSRANGGHRFAWTGDWCRYRLSHRTEVSGA